MGAKVEPESKKKQPLRILLSYHYFKQFDLDELFAKYFDPPYPDVLLDSGAWSVFTSGVTVDLDELCRYIQRYDHLLTIYMNLDDMLNPEITLRNQKVMEDRGLTPITVFHTGEPWRYLEHYCQNYPYVALGKITPYTNKKNVIMPWLVQAFRMAGSDTVFHGPGVTNMTLIKSFRWYSVDSSSWGSGYRFGELRLFNPKTMKAVKIELGDGRETAKYAWLIKYYGFDPMDFADRTRNDRAKICAINARSMMEAESFMTQLFGPVEIPKKKRLNPA